jgi:hypothetical protein
MWSKSKARSISSAVVPFTSSVKKNLIPGTTKRTDTGTRSRLVRLTGVTALRRVAIASHPETSHFIHPLENFRNLKSKYFILLDTSTAFTDNLRKLPTSVVGILKDLPGIFCEDFFCKKSIPCMHS